MDRRKSLGHVLTENAGSSPLRRRSSFAIRASTFEIEANDDAAERQVLRYETNVQVVPSSTSRRSVHLGAVSNMSTPQIAEGMAQCMRLNNQNKINIKNAFSLNMIDFMTYMVRNKSEGIPNLVVAGTTLDVSAKIYALRVDSLYQDTLKMSGNLDANNKKHNADELSNGDNTMTENSETDENNARLKKKKKKRASQKILTTIEALQGKVDTVDYTPIMFGDSDCQTTNMLYQASLPQHCGLGLSLNPYNDVIIDTANEDNENNEVRIVWPPIRVDFTNQQINNIFSTFGILHWSIEQEEGELLNMPSQESSRQDDDDDDNDDNLAFDLDASVPPEEDANIDGNFFHADENDDDEVEMGCHAQSRAPCVVADLPNIIARMPMNKKLEYSYLNEGVDIRWVGPSHWKINKLVNNNSKSRLEICQKNPKRKKKDLTIQSDDEHIEADNKKCALAKKDSITLKSATIKNYWSTKKLIISKENYEEDDKKLCKHYLRSDEILFFKNSIDNNNSVISDDNEAYNYDNSNDTLNYCPNIQADDDIGTGSNDCVYDDGSQPVAFTVNNLIEAPKLTQKIYIPFSQRAKKLDVRHLKKCIWGTLTDNQVDKENEKIKESLTTMKERKIFSDIYTKLPKMLSKSDAEELSFPIAFVSLLHLANEKTLFLSPEEDYGDIIIGPSTR